MGYTYPVYMKKPKLSLDLAVEKVFKDSNVYREGGAKIYDTEKGVELAFFPPDRFDDTPPFAAVRLYSEELPSLRAARSALETIERRVEFFRSRGYNVNNEPSLTFGESGGRSIQYDFPMGIESQYDLDKLCKDAKDSIKVK